MSFKSDGVKIGAREQTLAVEKEAKVLTFKGNFTKGETYLSAWFTTDKNVDWGAFYIRINRISKKFTLMEK
jgi:hypothetical protein